MIEIQCRLPRRYLLIRVTEKDRGGASTEVTVSRTPQGCHELYRMCSFIHSYFWALCTSEFFNLCFCYFVLCNFFPVGGCLLCSLMFTSIPGFAFWMPLEPPLPSFENYSISETLPNVPWETQLLLGENTDLCSTEYAA